ncbi:MAG TPA: hypothetical protein VFF67_10005 [Thermoplasmata archaeon]|nr:hypothetical protein [Thermoplasmata archaeon]
MRPRPRDPGRVSVAGALTLAILLVLPFVLGFVVGWFFLNPPQEEQFSPVGSEAHELLNSFPDASVTVEIAAPSGDAPPASAVELLWARMNETLQKSSIHFVEETYTSGQSRFTTTDLWTLERSVRTTWPAPGSMSLFYLFVPGGYGPDASVIGLAYYGSSIAVFPATIASAAGGTSAAVIATVMIHEFGHELGLVGIIGSAPNEDPNHPYHSSDPNDVMYWAVDTTQILAGLLGGGPPTQFDAQDLQDLSTVRNTVILQEVLPWAVLAVLLGSAVGVVVDLRRRRHRASPAPAPPAT